MGDSEAGEDEMDEEDEEGEFEMDEYDSEAEENIAEMMQEGLDSESSDEYGAEEGEEEG